VSACCHRRDISFYAQHQPDFILSDYFQGDIKGWGMIQSRLWGQSGRVLSRFDIDLRGDWHKNISGNEGVLWEKFNFYHKNTPLYRTWQLQKISPTDYRGIAADVQKIATGKTNGAAAHWDYQMNIDANGKTYAVSMDDWMYLMHDGVIINKTDIYKFGIKVAELTIFMKKDQNPPVRKKP
jgi:hypothetical protein